MNITNRVKVLLMSAVMACGLLSGAAEATVVKFENILSGGQTYEYFSGTRTVDGMVFSANNSYFMQNYHTLDSYAPVDPTGSLFTYSGIPITMSQANNALFSLSSFDAGVYLNQPGATVNFSGLLGNGNVITQSFFVSANAFTTFAFSSAWTSLQQVTFTMTNTSYIQYDNIVVNAAAIPEPSSLALMMLALGILAVATRRARRN